MVAIVITCSTNTEPTKGNQQQIDDDGNYYYPQLSVFVSDSLTGDEYLAQFPRDLCENAIRIHGKGKKIRYVPMTPAINKMMIRYLRTRENYIMDKYNYHTDYLLLSQKGKKLTPEAIERVVRTCGNGCKIREEIRCSPHTCRHYYAQAQLKNGCDLFTVSRLLGHNNINITKRYLNSIETDDMLMISQKTSPLRNIGA